MHDIEDLAAILGLSSPQIRRRLVDLDDLLRDHARQGKRNKIIIDSAGLEILKRVAEYEKQGLSISECKAIVKEELSISKNGHSGSKETAVKVDEDGEKLGEIFREQLREKDSQIKHLQDQISRLYDIIENRLALPPPQEVGKEAQKASRWQRLIQLVRGT
jgi:DNA-binding transcriptional MerR regulator